MAQQRQMDMHAHEHRRQSHARTHVPLSSGPAPSGAPYHVALAGSQLPASAYITSTMNSAASAATFEEEVKAEAISGSQLDRTGQLASHLLAAVLEFSEHLDWMFGTVFFLVDRRTTSPVHL